MTVAVTGARGVRPALQFEALDEGMYVVCGTASAPGGERPGLYPP